MYPMPYSICLRGTLGLGKCLAASLDRGSESLSPLMTPGLWPYGAAALHAM